jgi:hypothetical protein
MLRAVMEKECNIEEEMSNVRGEMGTLRKNKSKMLEIKTL